MHYFDHNSTTPLSPQAFKTLFQTYQDHWYNPSTLYRSGTRCNLLLEDLRQQLAHFFSPSTPPENLLFNSGATESTNCIFQYLLKRLPPDSSILISKAEHAAIAESAKFYFPNRFTEIPLTTDGLVDLPQLHSLLHSHSFSALFLCAAHNETGVIQPFPDVAQLCRQLNILYICDASQWIGKHPFAGLDLPDFVFSSAHKFGGPKGIGFLKLSENVSSFSSFIGGDQEHGHRAGTENLPSIASLLAALTEYAPFYNNPSLLTEQLNHKLAFESTLRSLIPSIRILGETAPRLWNTTALLMPFGESHRWVRLLDTLGFALSTGSACKSAKELLSSVWGSLGLTEQESSRVLRISSHWTTTPDDWQSLAQALHHTYQKLQSSDSDTSSSLGQVIQID